MNKNYHYLPVSLRELWSGYGLLYVPFIVLIILSERSFLTATFWYWLICGLLFIVEWKVPYFTITTESLTQKWLIGKVVIPLKSIKRVVRGERFGFGSQVYDVLLLCR
jgi:hypothetical protein